MLRVKSRVDLPLGIILCLCNLSLLAGCSRAPPEPENTPEFSANPDAASTGTEVVGGEPTPPDADVCLIPLAEIPAPEATSVTDCPIDPEGRPSMPTGTVTFPGAAAAPRLTVELALTNDHRSHGLMFRPTLEDNQGMLFSWDDVRRRSFWMKNTCLALDMLFIADDLTIAGVVEQVPPMNERPRGVACPAAHVLEVPAGWVRKYGVAPGQKITIEEAQ